MNTNTFTNELADVLVRLKNRKQMLEFLDGLLTPQELVELSQRLQIVKQLKQGIPQREIVANLGVGIATVTRGSREIQNGKFTQVSWRPGRI